jgi:hypothetical protein
MATKGKIIKEQVIHQKEARKIQLKEQYVVTLINARFILARCNMIAEQLEKGIKEDINGVVKTKEFMQAEYYLEKMKAIRNFRTVQGIVKDFLSYGGTQEELDKYTESYYGEPIIREDYEIDGKQVKNAGFVDSSTNKKS